MPPAGTRESLTEYLDELPASEQPTLTVAMGGQFGRLHIPGTPAPNQGRNRRGTIKRFSRAARKRLMDRLASIDRRQVRKMPLFITLTYPEVWPATIAECKRHLDTFCKRMRRAYDKFAAIWKLEFQSRGAPHFHLLVWGVEFIPYRQVAIAWFEVVGSQSPDHLAAGTEVKRVKSWRGVAYYASKYLAKVGDQEHAGETGRYWGIINRAALPVAMLVQAVAWRTAYQLRRCLWRRAHGAGYQTGRRTRWAGVSAYIDAQVLLDLASSLLQPGARCKGLPAPG